MVWRSTTLLSRPEPPNLRGRSPFSRDPLPERNFSFSWPVNEKGASRKWQPRSSSSRNASSTNLTSDVQRRDSAAPGETDRSVRRGNVPVQPLGVFFRLVSQPFTIPFKLGEGGWKERLNDPVSKYHAGRDGYQKRDTSAGQRAPTPSPVEDKCQKVKPKHQQHDQEAGKEDDGAHKKQRQHQQMKPGFLRLKSKQP